MISIIMSVYNEKIDWLKEAVYSILNQTYANFEFIIIIDNPQLPEELFEFLSEVTQNDPRIILKHNKQNMGLANSLNFAISLAKGKYIARMDADDISQIDRLEKEIKFLENNNYDMVSSNKINIDENSMYLSTDPIIVKNPNKDLIYSNFIVHPSVLIKTEVINKLGGYRLFINSEDYDLWLRLSENGYKIGIINDNLIKYRLRSNSASIGRQLEQYYITEYIRKLSYERKKNKGNDSFSTNNQLEYLNKVDMSEKAKKSFYIANQALQSGIENLYKKKYIRVLKNVLTSFFLCPKFTFNRIKNKIVMKIN